MTKLIIMRPFIVFVLTMACMGKTVIALPYPIDPRPLRKLILESEFIITGHVLEVREIKARKNDFSRSAIARIQITEVVQGKITDRIIEVPFNPHYICPAPARYIKNTDIIAFLNHKNGAFHTHALSYGVKTLSLAEIALYKARILEMQKIMQEEDSDQKFMKTIEWLVKCAEEEATRWEGTFELSPESDFMSFYSRSELPPYKYLLSNEQKERLKKALLTSRSLGYSNFGIVDLIYVGNENEIHGYLLQSLKKLPQDQLWMANEYMERLMYGKRSPAMEKLVESFSEKQFDYDKPGELKKIVTNFIALVEE